MFGLGFDTSSEIALVSSLENCVTGVYSDLILVGDCLNSRGQGY